MLKLRKNKKGFSLVELIVVIAIMAVLAGVVGGTLFSQLNKQKDNSAVSEAAGFAGSAKTAIQADAKYQSGKVLMADIVKDLIAESEGALFAGKGTDSEPTAGAPDTNVTVGKKAGDHQFVVYYTEPGEYTDGKKSGVIYIVCDSARSNKPAFGKTITYTITGTGTSSTEVVTAVTVVVADYTNS